MGDLPELQSAKSMPDMGPQVAVCRTSQSARCECLCSLRAAESTFCGPSPFLMSREVCLCSIRHVLWPSNRVLVNTLLHFAFTLILCHNFNSQVFIFHRFRYFFIYIYTSACIFAVTSLFFLLRYIIARFFYFPLLPLSEQSSSLSGVTA